MAHVPTATTPVTHRPKRWLGWLAVALALVGWWLSVDLLLVGAGAHATNPWLEATCGPVSEANGPSDCLSVINSRWARFELFGDPESATDQGFFIPWAGLGAAYFAFVALWYAFVGPPTARRWGWHLLITAVVALGVARSTQFMYVMAAVLHRWCSGCAAAHVVNGLLLVITIIALPWTNKTAGGPPHPQPRLALATLVAGVSVSLLHVFVAGMLPIGTGMQQLKKSYLEIVNDPAYAQWRYQQQSARTIPLRDDEIFAGSPEAPNTVVVFIDFQCSACKLAHDVVSDVVLRHADNVRVAFRHFPQGAQCNPQYQTGGHPAACRAARACEAARRVGGPTAFARMRKLLYERRGELELNRFNDWAGELGLDVAAFSDAMSSAAVAERIQADIDLGTRLGIKGMPVLFLNGRRVEHWRNPKTWEALLAPAGTRSAPTSQSQPASGD